MENKFFASTVFAKPSISRSAEQSTIQWPSKNRYGKKLYVTIAAIIAIAVIIAAVLLVPSSNADVISLGVHYSVGEKLTYDVTTAYSTQSENSSSNLSQQSTLTVEVVSFNGGTYTLNYTSISSVEGYSMTTSNLMEVKETDMVNLFTLVPVALQQGLTNSNSSSPVETAIFNQTQAKVGDTWQIPASAAGSGSSSLGDITIKFVDIENLATKAGTFKVFRIDFSQASVDQAQTQSLPANLNFGVSGTSYLEFGTCKQIQSTLQINMTSQLGGNTNANTIMSYTSTLTKDITP